jgi:hypothetical protein
LVDMVSRLLSARSSRRVVVPIRLPGATGRTMASGAALPKEPGPRGVQTFEEWLASDDAQAWL